ncbi:MAG: cytochrome ubiquinol oxidase subunit I [Planctomycetes bacterium]|nr:cytochrome ubiquinol oxidase subunit I [Planctomycetota bacterium]
MAPLLAARLQMALTLGFHIVLACLGVGLPILLLVAEWRHLRTGDEGWRTLARRWSKAFAVLFAVGAVSGTVLSFELGLLWPRFMGTFGAVIGMPFSLEAFAFFLEAIFVGIYLYGWDRLPPRVHWLTGFPVALAGFASAWFVVTANAWMNTPQGFRLEGGIVTDADPWRAMFNPAAWAQATHMILAAYAVTGFVVASVYAVRLLRKPGDVYSRRALALGVGLAALASPVQLVAGDWIARTVAHTQPVKLAALEGQFQTQAGAPLRVGGLEIPGGLSWLAYGDPDAVVMGLNDVPRENRPPVAVVHTAFQAMVLIGFALAGIAIWVAIALLLRRRFPEGRAFLWAIALAGPLSIVALECGWIVTEVGRQPWIVQGVMRTADAVTDAPGLAWSLAVTMLVYAALGAGTVAMLRILARTPLPEKGDGA